MELVHGLPQPINERPTILTIGAFDGVHRGHQHLIGSVAGRAHALDHQSAVLTFDPHPDLVLHPSRQRLYLTNIEERAALIEQLGVDLLIVLPFTQDIAALTAEQFVGQICKAVALRELWVGWDFALGRRREGNLAKLRELGHQYRYHLHPVDALLIEGLVVSSTRIRAALQQGDLATATLLLGRPFSIRGQVVEGNKRGRTIGFPTANLAVDQLRLLPSDGVYVCHAWLGNECYGAVTNIGLRPTFGGTLRTIEAYLLDFSDDIYNESLRLTFLHRLRGEQKFESVAALIAQISNDTQAARAWLRQHAPPLDL